MILVCAALLVHNGKLLIAQRQAPDSLAGLWEFPGGKLEVGESPEECLYREMLEEFGIKITPGPFFGESVYAYPEKTICLRAYWAFLRDGVAIPRVHSALQWVTPEELLHYKFAPADVPLVTKLSQQGKFISEH